jgi:hypothetical protein
MKPLRRHLNYANVVATLALLFAMSGGALAANHYLINSTKQINPKVRKALKGNAGKKGPTGPQGANGGAGSRGSTGPTGAAGLSALAVLPSGQTESGDYGTEAPGAKAGETFGESITFPVPLQEGAPAGQIRYTPATVPVEHCSGPGHADKGFVCIYSTQTQGVTGAPTVFTTEVFPTLGTGRLGFFLQWTTTAADAFDVGTYTVTAG